MPTQRTSANDSAPPPSGAGPPAATVRPPRWKTALRVLIAALVAIGLWQAVTRSAAELARRSAELDAEIAELHEALEAEQRRGGATERASALRRKIETLERQRPRLDNLRWTRLVLAGGLYALALVPAAIFWHRVLLALAQRPRWTQSVPAHLIGHLGKYVPGKALVVVMRAGGVAGPQVSFAAAALAAVVETLTMMAVGGALAGLLVLVLPAPPWIRLLALGLAVAAAVPTAPPVFRRVVNVLSRGRAAAVFRGEGAAIRWPLMISGWGWMLASWLGIGLAFYAVLQALPSVADEPPRFADAALAIAAIALAIVAGFVSLLPGGAGVRELVLSTLLAPRFGLPTALAAALLARLVFLVAELLVAMVAKAVARWGQTRAQQIARDSPLGETELG